MACLVLEGSIRVFPEVLHGDVFVSMTLKLVSPPLSCGCRFQRLMTHCLEVVLHLAHPEFQFSWVLVRYHLMQGRLCRLIREESKRFTTFQIILPFLFPACPLKLFCLFVYARLFHTCTQSLHALLFLLLCSFFVWQDNSNNWRIEWRIEIYAQKQYYQYLSLFCALCTLCN